MKNYFSLSDYNNNEEQETLQQPEMKSVDEGLATARPKFPQYRGPLVQEVEMKKVDIEEPEEPTEVVEETEQKPMKKGQKYPSLKPEQYLGRAVPPNKESHYVNVSFNIKTEEMIGLLYALRIAKNISEMFEDIVKGDEKTIDILDVGSIEEIEEAVKRLTESHGFDI